MKNKFYIILGYNALDESYCGYVENSFSMGCDDDRVYIWSANTDFPWKNRDFATRKKIAKSYIKENGRNCSFARDYIIDADMNPNSANQWIWFYLRDIANNLNKKQYNNCYWEVYRVNSDSCPVKVDMNKYFRIHNNKKYKHKYQLRNINFTKREPLLVNFLKNN